MTQHSGTWQPTISLPLLRQRAALLRSTREFFASREVVEVDTPLLGQRGVTDPHLENFEVLSCHYSHPLLLQTSPEFAMKRLLAAGSGSIYQLGKAFRNEPPSRRHQPEFTLLEWYRVGFSMHDLMHEVDDYLQQLLQLKPSHFISYRDLFQDYLGCDICAANGLEQLQAKLQEYPEVADLAQRETDFDTLQQLAMSCVIEAQLPTDRATFVYHFPISQAALAAVCPEDERFAQRFEVYVGMMELANGYYELTDAAEQARRFRADQNYRERHQLCQRQEDERLVQALESGLPSCAGVALGFDRLVMLASGQADIRACVPFAIERA